MRVSGSKIINTKLPDKFPIKDHYFFYIKKKKRIHGRGGVTEKFNEVRKARCEYY
jgi:hypothetical protein